ncbi:MAG: DUF2279 domain-containing protein [Chitinophagales bacterium]
MGVLKYIKGISILIFVLLMCLEIQAQDRKSAQFFKPDTTLNKMKVGVVTGSILTIYGGALIGLNQYWYKDIPRSRFHFHNDGRDWMQIDKAGHIYSAYFQSRWAVGMYRWTGMEDKKAIWVGGMTGTFLQSSIEILDAFSADWGFSAWDFGANVLGSAIVISQELAWKEQRISLKISTIPQKYPEGELKNRASDLYGTSLPELFLKDYNAVTTWASVNIASFIKRDTRFPDWINIAVGYGARNMYGGSENIWCTEEGTKAGDCPPGMIVDRTDVQRNRQFYISPDIDFTRIPVRRKGFKILLNMLNMVKVPFPSLEINTQGKVRVQPY